MSRESALKGWATRRELGHDRKAIKRLRAFLHVAFEQKLRRQQRCIACSRKKAKADREHWYCAECRARYAANQRVRMQARRRAA